MVIPQVAPHIEYPHPNVHTRVVLYIDMRQRTHRHIQSRHHYLIVVRILPFLHRWDPQWLEIHRFGFQGLKNQ